MSVNFKSDLTSNNVNTAFASKTEDNTLTGKQTLADPDEGGTIVSEQKALNELFENQGTSEGDANARVYTSTNYIANDDAQKVCIEKLDDQVGINETSISSHITDPTDAHEASAIGYDDTTSGNGQSDVQGAIDDNEARVQTIEDGKGQPNGYASLDGSGRIPSSQLSLDATELKGFFDPVLGSPALADGVGTKGDFYIVEEDGSYDFGSGSISMLKNDEVIYVNSVWNRLPGAQVRSFNGRTGDVSPQSGDYTATDVGLGNVTNDAQLKREAGDFATFTEKPIPVEADIVLIEDSEAAGAKKKVQLANLLGGGGGGGSFVWELNGDTSPYESISSGISTLDFDDISDAEMYALLTVPDSYSAGDQILLKGMKYFTSVTTGNVFFRTITQLLKVDQDMSALPITGHTSANTEQTITGAANALKAIGDLDLCDGSGEINSVAVAAGDTLLVRFLRDNTNETTSAAADCQVLKFSASVKFDA